VTAGSLPAELIRHKRDGGTFLPEQMHAIALEIGTGAFSDAQVGSLAEVGCAVIGQTDDLAPADRRLYGIRDAAGTVETIDLLVPSILSKKLSEGLDAVVLARRALELAGVDADPAAALHDGRAAEVFGRMVAALGGPADVVERPVSHLRAAPVVLPVHPEGSGVVTGHETRDLGVLVVELGGGRRGDHDAIDHAVGLSQIAAPGEAVGHGEGDRPLCVVHAASAEAVALAARAIRAHIHVGDSAPEPVPLITEELR
jgi:thymidine phosphorylase